MPTLGILCSGGLGFETLYKIAKRHAIKFVLTDKGSKAVIDFAARESIPFYVGNPRNGKGYDFIKTHPVDVIISINYLFLIDDDIIRHSNKLTFNIHGSLLPKYRGRTPHVWAIIKGENKAGITAHEIDAGCDTGKILLQKEIPIEENDTGATMLEKYAKAYYPIIENVLNDLESGTLVYREQDETKATYFGKRTPLDGEINWEWDKERIRNWIRAQANPYPGAFTYYEGKKIIIDKVSFSQEEVNESTPNGEIIQTSPYLKVKTRNGVLILDSIRSENTIFEKGKKLTNENWK